MSNETIKRIFNEGDTACFMDTLHPVGIPSNDSVTSYDTSSFVTMLEDSLSNLPYGIGDRLFMEPDDYACAYNETGAWSTLGSLDTDYTLHLPFVWFPAVADGSPYKVYTTIQEPTGTMASYGAYWKRYTWQDRIFNSTDYVTVTVMYCNKMTGLTGANFIAIVIGDKVAWWSGEDQTVKAAYIRQAQTWEYGDVTLSKGFNMTTSVSSGSNTTVPVDASLLQSIGLIGTNIPLSSMDSFEKSLFKDIMQQPYRRVGKQSITIDFTIKMT